MAAKRTLALVALALGGLALLAPWMVPTVAVERVGALLMLAALLQGLQGFRRRSAASQRAAWLHAGITLAMGVLLIGAPWLAAGALILLLAGWFGVDAIRQAVLTVRLWMQGAPVRVHLLGGAGNLAVAGGLLILGHRGAVWATAIAGALRIVGTAADIAVAPAFAASDSGHTVVDDLGLPDEPDVRAIAGEIDTAETRRAPVDRGWVIAFSLTLFAIHLGRTGFDKSALGVLTPMVAVLGDYVVGLAAAFAVVLPLRLTWLRLTRRPWLGLWYWQHATPVAARTRRHALARAVLLRRLRTAIRLRRARYSLPTALSQGLQVGLPIAAIIAATAPVFGMSWYFDTENWRPACGTRGPRSAPIPGGPR